MGQSLGKTSYTNVGLDGRTLSAMLFTLSVRSFHVPLTPGTEARPPSLPSVPTSRATLTRCETNPERVNHRSPQELCCKRVPGNFCSERRQTLRHAVHGLLQLQNLSFDVDFDPLGQVSLSDGLGDFGDGTDLGGEIQRLLRKS